MVARPVFDRPIAHRGLHDQTRGVIENSVTAFEEAIAAGYAIECDLQLSADDVPIVFHDDTLDRLVGRPGKIGEFNANELTGMALAGSAAGDRPQRFAELLEQVHGRTLLQVELKPQARARGPAMAKAAVEMIRGYPGPLVFESFDPGLLMAVRASGFGGARGIITERYDRGTDDHPHDLSSATRFALRHLLHYPATRFDFISAAHDALDLPAIRLFRGLGLPVTSWTIRSAEMAAAVGKRADQLVFEGFVPPVG